MESNALLDTWMFSFGKFILMLLLKGGYVGIREETNQESKWHHLQSIPYKVFIWKLPITALLFLLACGTSTQILCNYMKQNTNLVQCDVVPGKSSGKLRNSRHHLIIVEPSLPWIIKGFHSAFSHVDKERFRKGWRDATISLASLNISLFLLPFMTQSLVPPF